jgi:peptide/nickel transport system substrate-binding protein
MNRDMLSRRQFLRAAALTAAGAAAVACQPQTVVVKETVEVEKVVKETVQVEVEKEVTKVVAKEVTKVVEKMVEVTAVPEVMKESPLNYGQVAAGKLPPVDERLPAEPLVWLRGEGFEQEIGTYGGTIQLMGGADDPAPRYEFTLSLNRFCTSTIPCVVKGWEFAEDGKSVTYMYRKGMKWSDGEPFTADDVLYWWEDEQLNTDLFTRPYSYFVIDGEPMTVEKVDDYTVKFSFKLPYWVFIHQFDGTGYRGSQFGNDGYSCKHYGEQFHPKYNPEAVANATAAKYDDWMSYYNYKMGGVAPGLPLLAPWTNDDENPTGDSGARNAYYFKVDTEGNQMPYIDTYNRSWRGDPETRVLQITAGQVDFEAWGLTVTMFPVLKSGEDAGGYDVWMGVDLWPAATQLAFNHCYVADPEIGDLLRNAQFRRALSVAINRDEINDVQFLGYGRPVQVTVTPDTPWYKEEWAQAYAEYDPDQANAWLDEIGLDKKDADGFRLLPSGKKLSIVLDVCNAVGFWVPTSEMVKEYWDAVGVSTVLNNISSDLLWEREGSNEDQIWVWVRDAVSTFMMNLRTDTLWWTFQQYSNWWFSKDDPEPAGIEPPDDIKKLYEAQDGWTFFDEQQLAAAVDVIWGDQAENIRCIGTGAPGGQPCITNKKLGNVDKEAHADSYDTGGINNNWLEMFFWKA